MSDRESKETKDEESSSEETEIGSQDVSRRDFLKNAGVATGGVIGGALLGGLFTQSLQTDTKTTTEPAPEDVKEFMEARMFFTRYEDFAVLEQATERIFPEDDNGPGAIGLGVPFFIDKQLAGPWGMNAKDYRQGPFLGSESPIDQSIQTRGEVFLQGLRTMNQLSKEKFDKTFDQAEEEQQIEILQEFEAGNVEMKGVDSSSFFMLLRESTLEGAYSDPLYGGNKDMAGWKMKEFPGAVPSYTDIIESEEFVNMDPIGLTDYQQKS